ncbi:MAG TPA: ABC transporter substrate-binding protein [Candidatus Binatia bacterium]|nr:ABC transporter substrate-binding protein [Candidatus Binatia bacterium]
MTVLLALAAVMLLATGPVHAQPSTKLPRVGYLHLRPTTAPIPSFEAFQEGLRQLGYVQGETIIIEYRAADEPARLAEITAELVRIPVDVIVAPGAAIHAAKAVSTAVPVVFGFSGDPVEAGLVASLARPGGNMTGVTLFALELAGKRLELLKDTAPWLSRVAVLAHPNHPGEPRELEATKAAARMLGITLLHFPVKTLADIDHAFRRMLDLRAEAVLAFPDHLTGAARREIAEFALRSRLPTVFGWRPYVDAGGLLSYGPRMVDTNQRMAGYVARILKGARPADLPVEQPTLLELVINLRTAQRLGIEVPAHLLMEADHVIR